MLHPLVQPTGVAREFLENSLDRFEDGWRLYTWKTHWWPMDMRHGRGARCVEDLEEEVAIQKLLATLRADQFLLARCGADPGIAGELTGHPFAEVEGYEEVLSALAGYVLPLTQRVGTPKLLQGNLVAIFDAARESRAAGLEYRNSYRLPESLEEHRAHELGWHADSDLSELEVVREELEQIGGRGGLSSGDAAREARIDVLVSVLERRGAGYQGADLR